MSSWTLLRGLLSSDREMEVSEGAELERSFVRSVPDEVLMQHIEAGDANALAMLYDRYCRLLLGVCIRILRDAGEAQELLQEVFLYIFRKSASFDPAKSSFRSWAVQIAYSRALNRRKYLLLRKFYDYCHIDAALQCESSDFSPEKVGEIAELRELLRSAFETLTEPQKTTLELFFWQGYSLKEISLQLNESLGNTRHHYYRAIARLREILKESLAPSASGGNGSSI